MKRILLSACDRTYTQLGNQEALVSLLKGAGYDVSYTSEVSKQEWVNYPLIIAFKDEEYVRLKEMNLQNNLLSVNELMGATCLLPSRDRWTNNVNDNEKKSILIWVNEFHPVLRVLALLKGYSTWSTASVVDLKLRDFTRVVQTFQAQLCQTSEVMEHASKADLIISDGLFAAQAVLNYKPVIIVDSYGWNGLVTDATFMSQYVAGFTAKPVQSDRGYFPLYDLSIAINRAFEMEQSELKSCSNKLLQENEHMCEKILRVVSSRC